MWADALANLPILGKVVLRKQDAAIRQPSRTPLAALLGAELMEGFLVDELERTIATLIKRLKLTQEGRAEHAFIMRQLMGLAYTREDAVGIIESETSCYLDPFIPLRPLEKQAEPEGLLLPLRRKAASHR